MSTYGMDCAQSFNSTKELSPEGYVSDFSPDGKLFGLLDSDGRFKIWDVGNNFLTRPNHHLESQYVCFTWLKVCSKNAIEGYENYIALGKIDGGVDLYSYTTGSIKCTLSGNGHTEAVASICSRNSTLYTCGMDRRIVGWSLEDYSQFTCVKVGRQTTPPTSILSLPSSYLLVACQGLRLWSLPSNNSKPKMKFEFPGHSTDVSSMKLVKQIDQNVVYVVTAAMSSREIFLWKVNASKMDADANVMMKYAANFIGCSILGNKLMITTVKEANDGASVDLFVIEDMSKINRGQKPITLAVKSAGSVNNPRFVPIVVATLKSSNHARFIRIQIGYGSCSSLRFEEINTTKRSQMLELERHDPRTLMHRESILTPVRDGDSDVTNERLTEIKIGGLRLALDHSDTNLRAIFCIQDKNLIDSTVAQLEQIDPTVAQIYILRLVEELTLLIQRKTFNVRMAECWLDSLLRIMSSHLRTSETNNLGHKLRTLAGVIKKKNRFLAPLIRLNGRLNSLLSQRMQNTNDGSGLMNDEHAPVYDVVEEHHMIEWDDGDVLTDEEGEEMNSPE